MNEYTINDLTVGQEESFTKEITKEMEDAFREITGDVNPLHMDDEFAKTVKGDDFKGHVAFGMLTASLCSTLAGVYLPGKYSLIHSFDKLDFRAPVYAGDTITVTGKVTDVDKDLRLIRIDVKMVNQDKKTVSKAKMKIMVLR